MGRRRRRWEAMLFLALLSLAASGCWDHREIESLAVATAMAVDRAPDGNGILLTGAFSIPQPTAASGIGGGGAGGGASGGTIPFARTTFGPRGPTAWITGATGPSLVEARERLEEVSPRQPFWAHLRLIVVGERLAASGLRQVLESVARDREFRRTSWLAVARGMPAYRLLDLPGPFTGSPEHLARLEDILRRTAVTAIPQRLHEFLAAYEQPGIDPVAPGFVAEKPLAPDMRLVPLPAGEWPAVARVEGTAIFQDDRLVGWLSGEETRALQLLRGASRPFTISVACPKGRSRAPGSGPGPSLVAIRVVRWRVERRLQGPEVGGTMAPAAPSPGPPVTGLPRFTVEIRAEGQLGETLCPTPLGGAGVRAVEQEVVRLLTADVRHTIRKVHGQLHADPVGFGLQVYRSRPDLWEALEPRWRTILARLPVEVRVRFQVRRFGLTEEEVTPR
ncbi:Ger(x)C family spore germination C-terminal domain-containing protein [Carboxydochorda subterranea]|uniref:Ger(X)C family spore germination C-terminal domain-containing protein n=1 Tax=Carboxydichorda subterranea TaxID=3109565 RepID=A0ABZ1BTG8_9FIRM|nr:Ger(x)C family spore germination C-terminal domain-containing protein [Limnochorda sp. L945t]WRP16034.1 Ger(x)C family spore germination C-terminal domain-containing protein [Limnochorda sp. L945t]